jgi:hypothetical protein
MAMPPAPRLPTPAQNHVLDVYFRLYQSHTTMMMHQERSQYVLMRAFFQIITVVFVVEHLPLQMIRDQSIVMLLSFFIKMSLFLTSYTMLRKAHRANFHETSAGVYLRKITEFLKNEDNEIDPDVTERKTEDKYRLINYLIFPQINRMAVGITFLLFSFAIAAFVTIK